MASLHIGTDKLIEIRTSCVDFVIKAKGKQQASAGVTEDESSPVKVIGACIERVSIPTQLIAEEYEKREGVSIHELIIAPLLFEQTDYAVTIRSRNKEQLQFRSNDNSIEERISQPVDDDPTLLTGVINYGNNVGFSDFTVCANGKPVLVVRLEVYPAKISYKKDYREMMTDINNMVSECALAFMKRTFQVFVPNHKRNDVPAVFFTILRGIYDDFDRAVNRILASPHHKLISDREIAPEHKVKQTDLQSEKWLRKHPEYIVENNGVIHAEKVLAVKKRITYDTQENRLVKFMLQSTIHRIEDFSRRYRNTSQDPDATVLAETGKMADKLRKRLSTPFFSEVSEYNASHSMSLVFEMAPGYRELYRFYIMLLNGISVGGDIFRMSVRETAELYEYWCFIKLYDILRTRYTLASPDIIKVNRRGVTIDLARGRQSRVDFLNTKTGEFIYLTYNPTETETQTVNQRPDNVLELEKRGSKTTYKYVFDAKYRIEQNPDGRYYPDSRPGPKVDDINTMHRYRDSIVYENPNSRFTFEKTMFGAYILFPYSGNEEEYRNHRFFKSIESVNIGGLPFLPSATSLVTELLDELISDSPESAFERATLPKGIETRLGQVNWEKRDVLVGFVPDTEHYNMFLGNNCYFTRRFDVANLPVHYIALYEKGKGILKYGEVVSWRKTPRRDLPGHSKFGSEEYHVFEVLKWRDLPQKQIRVSEFGPSPIAYTNFFLLTNSSTYSELMLRNETDYRFFSELKRIAAETSIHEDRNATAFEFGSTRVFMDDTNINVFIDNHLVDRCAIDEFSRHPNATFRRLQRKLESLEPR